MLVKCGIVVCFLMELPEYYAINYLKAFIMNGNNL